MNLNKVLIAGRLTRDPQLSSTPAGVAACDFGLAVNEKWKGADGQMQEEVTFIDCRAWKRTAEVINEHFSKGKPIFIEGKLHLSQWEDKDNGAKRSKMSVTVRSFEFISEPQGGQQAPQQQQQAPPQIPPYDPTDPADIPF